MRRRTKNEDRRRVEIGDLTVFSNPEFGKIRTLTIDGEAWFVGKDVAVALGYGKGNADSKSLTNAIKDHVDDEDKRLLQYDEVKGYQNGDFKNISHYGITIVNESGMYALVFGSKLENAKRFKHWVTSEVLPTIRKTGSYGVPNIEQRRTKILETETKIHLADQMLRIWDTAGIKPIYQALAMNSYYEELSLPREAFPTEEMAMLDLTMIAKDLGIKSDSGRPHAQAVGAIIKKLKLSADECADAPYCRNGHDGVSTQYKPSVKAKIKQWLDENGHPNTVTNGKSTYRIKYDTK